MSAAEPDRQFIDTNVLVYAHDAGAGAKNARAQELLGEIWQEATGCLSIQVLQEFYVTATGKLARRLDPESAALRVEAYSRWTLHTPDRSDVLAAIAIARRNRLSLWDAMIVRSASRLGCRVLWTEDLKDGAVLEGVRIRNPFK
ncbi:MAG TPA: PIN domain-containing protein [Thermoanaerobaculia bacterium]|jgi:predicted nucleic acid-binding protein